MSLVNILKALWRSLFPHKKTVRYILTGIVLLFVGGLATHCRTADASEVTFEAGAQYLRGPAATIVMSIRNDGPGDSSIESGLFLVGQKPDGNNGVMGGQVLLVDGFKRLDIGIGLAYMNHQHVQLGSQLNFALMVRYRITDKWQVSVRHWSNASTTDENTGLDIITVGYRF